MENLWLINEETFSPDIKKLRSQETVYTVGNGYFATRGAFEEGYPRANPATLLFGVFDNVPIAKEELANSPDWTTLHLFVNGERFRLDRGTILSYQRTLDLQHGLLQRSVHWESPSGLRIRVTSERFASLADEHAGAIRFRISADENSSQKPITIMLHSSFNLAVGNYDLMHFDHVDMGGSHELLWYQTQTKQSKVQLAQTMSFTVDAPDFLKETIESDIDPAIEAHGQLLPGQTLTAEKIVVMYTSRDDVLDVVTAALDHHERLLTPAASASDTHAGSSFDRLLTASQNAWLDFWQQADVIIEGDAKAQRAVRYNLYQLRINSSAHDDRYSIAAKGLTGFGYRGHVFHDTEVFMLPFFTYVLPDVARNLLLYRYHTLPAARKKALNNGYSGAQYPWESTLSGEETTPPAIIHPETGELIAVLNGSLELHITSSIAQAVWEYWRVTADEAFMRDYGAEILLSTAQFWASRVEKHPEYDDYEITNVIGPDEWHEHVNNNAHTNMMARANLTRARHTLDWLQKNFPAKASELRQQLGITAQDLALWQEIEQKIRIPQDPQSGLIEQFDGFFKLARLDLTPFEGRKDSYQGLLGMEGVQKYQIVKQADVLMLLTMLNQEFDHATKQANWDYYYPITDHLYGSSLTPALHVILASELGLLEEAYKLFMLGALVDLENLRGNTPEGVHAACSGAVWQAAILGIAGLRITEDGYTTNPHLPAGWTRLAFTFKLKGQTICIDLQQ